MSVRAVGESSFSWTASVNNSDHGSVSKVKDYSSIVGRLQVSAPSNNGMHPTADTSAVIIGRDAGRARDAQR
jgi:hypothetical protein